jgi:hypothetical protein
MVYVDANVFLYRVIHAEEVEKARLSKKILLRIARGEMDACTASLTWDELVWVVKKLRGIKVARVEGGRLLRFPNLKILSVDGVLSEAQRIIEAYDVGPRDAIHAACALKNRIKEIISDDEDFDRIEEITRIPLRKAVR